MQSSKEQQRELLKKYPYKTPKNASIAFAKKKNKGISFSEEILTEEFKKPKTGKKPGTNITDYYLVKQTGKVDYVVLQTKITGEKAYADDKDNHYYTYERTAYTISQKNGQVVEGITEKNVYLMRSFFTEESKGYIHYNNEGKVYRVDMELIEAPHEPKSWNINHNLTRRITYSFNTRSNNFSLSVKAARGAYVKSGINEVSVKKYTGKHNRSENNTKDVNKRLPNSGDKL